MYRYTSFITFYWIKTNIIGMDIYVSVYMYLLLSLNSGGVMVIWRIRSMTFYNIFAI